MYLHFNVYLIIFYKYSSLIIKVPWFEKVFIHDFEIFFLARTRDGGAKQYDK